MKKLYLLPILTLIAFVLIYSCSTEEEDTTPPPSIVATPEPEPPAPTQYTLTVTAGEGGTVSSSGGTYDEGTSVTITATPNEGYQFIGWEGSDSETNSLSITLNGNTTVQALFQSLPFVSTAERYSAINETTGYYSKAKGFKRYISLNEAIYLSNTTGYFFDNIDAITSDFNNDGKLDLFWFGMSNKIWGCCHDNGKYFFISDYFNNTPPYDIIEHSSSIEFLSGGIDLQDIDNDGNEELILYSTNIHQINTFGGGIYITDTTNPPSEKGVVILKHDNNFNIIQEYEIGTPKVVHRGTSGDVDNDGDIDILNFPNGHPFHKSTFEKFPTILYNDGNGNFSEEIIFKDLSVTEYYYSINGTTNDFFDIDGDGNLDLITGQEIGVPKPPNTCCPVNFYEPKHAYILWGDGTGKFDLNNKTDLVITNSLGFMQGLMGLGFTDYDLDGDIDIILQATRVEEGGSFNDRPATMYFSYIINLIENKGNRNFTDVTDLKIDGNYHINVEHLADMCEMMSIDKDGDGDFDLVPKDVKVFCCLSGNYDFVSDLYWENIGGSFVRRIND